MQEAQELSQPKRIANEIDQAVLATLVDCIPALVAITTASGEVEFVNKRVEEYFGRRLEDLKNWATSDAIHPDDRQRSVATWKRSLESGGSYDFDHRLRRFDGVYRWFDTAGMPLRDAHGDIIRWYVLLTDIEERKRSESLLGAEKRTLEMIVGGASLIEILNALCDTIEAQAPGIISTATLMDPDGKRLWPVAGRQVPKDWIAAISPAPIGPCVGSCGTAAFRGQRVIASDIAIDPLWIDYRERALSNGLRAAWAEPLLSKDHEVLGTFAIYYSEPRTPSESDLQLIEGAGHVAVIAIEGERARAALAKATEELKKSEAELRMIVDAIPQSVSVLTPDGRNIYQNQALMDYTGLTKEEVMAEDFRARVFHPEDVQRLHEARQQGLACGVPFQNEQRARRRDGQYRWFLIQCNPLLDERGEVIRWYATGTDIEDRKQAEERARKRISHYERKSIDRRCSKKS